MGALGLEQDSVFNTPNLTKTQRIYDAIHEGLVVADVFEGDVFYSPTTWRQERHYLEETILAFTNTFSNPYFLEKLKPQSAQSIS